ncbi:hypothetical protein DIU31_027715 [Mucilaginibacter rubeus]|uniref:Uncharacterized protein n=1 Tax=Mucilaginibacter rubeus TaxID=2027860 RepID=A0AAE6JJX6_9SPHI|nr:hypothetical protein [Mucilaginibacter rubeus]QEM07109.1 hypothetical protein DIU31_027715 [Mucilaginibacter rubeus]QTE43748.1 hypothetical protein J3L19_33350 [Mucilaginibacter rubeus]QTE50347.1 hypothetical protein J3L21_33305 [Mucilaginibacter rubeus]QTE55434.1 hypothetical protein J3L23_24920 [Mucilaginibacter rubeus]QTE65104.1 hypothetical protein J3L22_08900 [Mucilaginibacter rubeus]
MKKLKCFLILAGGFLAISQSSFAQKDSSGIYRTAADFQQKKLSYAINYKTEKHKINDDFLFSASKIKVVHEGKAYFMDKNSTYGYKSTAGEVFRFVDNKEYKMLNPEGQSLLLYAFSKISTASKGNVRHYSVYFFSTNASSVPQPLTKSNLKAAFPDNHKFHDTLDENFKTDDELAAYDGFHKMYKVIRVFESSLK